MKKVLIIFGIIFILADAIFVYEQVRQSFTDAPQPILTATPTPLPTVTLSAPPAPPISHAGMKLYRNEQYGFEFWYPEGWEIKENTFHNAYSKFNLEVDLPDDVDTVVTPSFGINIVDTVFADQSRVIIKNLGASTKDVSVDGTVVTQYTYKYENIMTVDVDIHHDPLRILIDAQAKHEKEFNQILATFKFLK